MVKMNLQQRLGSLAVAAVLTAGVLSPAAVAQKAATSDAQVESNVLKALAADSTLTNQPIQSSTAFGVVTLSGAVQDNATRDRAEQIASRTDGVKKVVDQLSVGAAAVQSASAAPAQAGAQASQDYDPASQNTLPEGSNSGPMNTNGQPIANQQNGGNTAGNQYPLPGYSNDPANTGSQQNGYPQGQYPQQQGQYPQAQGQYPQQQGQYPQQQGQYPQAQGQYPQQQGQYPPQQGQYPPQQGQYPPQQGQYPQAQGNDPQSGYGQPAPRMYRRDWERQQAAANGQQNGNYAPQGQPGGQPVTVPAGVVLPVRITRWITAGDAQPGSTFTAVVNNDILAGGLIAIPRGAEVQGTVVDAKGSGVLKGRSELVLQLNTLNLGGRQTPLISDTFSVNGRDKTARSVNSTIGGAAVGALIGAVAGGGTGAAIGAGVGGAAGLGASAASRGDQAAIPAEALLQFRLTAPLPVVTVSEAEMQRLGNFAGPNGARRPVPAYGYGGYPPPPGYYGRPYRGYYGY